MTFWSVTIANAQRTQEINYRVESVEDVDMMEMLRRINSDLNDPTSRVVMIRELKR